MPLVRIDICYVLLRTGNPCNGQQVDCCDRSCPTNNFKTQSNEFYDKAIYSNYLTPRDTCVGLIYQQSIEKYIFDFHSLFFKSINPDQSLSVKALLAQVYEPFRDLPKKFAQNFTDNVLLQQYIKHTGLSHLVMNTSNYYYYFRYRFSALHQSACRPDQELEDRGFNRFHYSYFPYLIPSDQYEQIFNYYQLLVCVPKNNYPANKACEW